MKTIYIIALINITEIIFIHTVDSLWLWVAYGIYKIITAE